MGCTQEQRNRLRMRFQEDARVYDRARPSYPSELFDDLAQLAAIGEGSRVLEIGCGTGQATGALLRLGAQVTALELGAAMIEIARERLAASAAGQVRFVNVAFEEWDPAGETFDVVVAFTAWHWLDPALRTRKVAAALAPAGTLATVSTRHVAGGTVEFFDAAQSCYLRWKPPGAAERAAPPGAAQVPNQRDEVDGSGLFEPAVHRRYEWEQTYSTEAYLDLLSSYSDSRDLPSEHLEGLLRCIGSLIDERFAGQVVKRYLNELRVCRRSGGTCR